MLTIAQLAGHHTLPGHRALELALRTTETLVRPIVTVAAPVTQLVTGHTLAGLTPELAGTTLGTIQLVTPVSTLGLTVTPPLDGDTGGTSSGGATTSTGELCWLTGGRVATGHRSHCYTSETGPGDSHSSGPRLVSRSRSEINVVPTDKDCWPAGLGPAWTLR